MIKGTHAALAILEKASVKVAAESPKVEEKEVAAESVAESKPEDKDKGGKAK